jgi:neutral ceramidase
MFWCASLSATIHPGPGSPGFYQGDTNGHSIVYTPLSGVLNGLFKAKPTKEEEECQHPKPILLNVGAAQKPYPMVPAVVEVSVFRIGSLVSTRAAGPDTELKLRVIETIGGQALMLLLL